jgi:tetratricopeptide (TPR) repeat protein
MFHSSGLYLYDIKHRIDSEGGTSTSRGSDPERRDSNKVLISSLTVSNDGRLVACTVPLQFDGATPAIVVLIDPDDGGVFAQVPLRTTARILPTFSPSNRQLVTTEFWGTHSILSDIDSHSLNTRRRIPSHGPPLCAGFSPDGDVLAIGDFYNEIRLHGSAAGDLIQTLKEHSNWPNNVAFSRDGRHLTSYIDIGLYVSNGDVDIPSMLNQVTDRVPENPHLHTALALRFVEQQRWRDAAVQFHTSARILDEPTLPKWMWAALMYRHSGDLNRYHELTTEIIERIRSEESAERLGGVVKACLLAEPSVENLSGLIEMADRALQLDPNHASAKIAKALAAYWSEDFEDAIRWAHQCGDDDRQALCVLALANAAAGQIDLARQHVAQLQQGSDGFHIQVSLKRQDAAHEAAFFKILLEEVTRTLGLE